MKKNNLSPILIFGATGFVGQKLLEKLILQKKMVIAITRDPKKITRSSKYLTVIKGDLLKPQTYKNILKNVKIVYFLVHAMDQGEDFENLEKKQATYLANLLKKDQKIIYLSGLGKPLSPHIKSRQKVGEIFAASQAQSCELRASIIIGAGSLSFEMIYAIVKRFPLTFSTLWSQSLCQPVFIDDVINTLIKLKNAPYKKNIYEIGGSEKLYYDELIIKVANITKKKMPQVFIKNLSKDLVLKVMAFMLPEYYQTGKHLMGSIEIPTTAQQNILKDPTPLNQAISKAIKESDQIPQTYHFTWADKVLPILEVLPPSYLVYVKKSFRLFKSL